MTKNRNQRQMDHALLCLGTSENPTHDYVQDRLYLYDSEIIRPFTGTRKLPKVPILYFFIISTFMYFSRFRLENTY